MTTQEADGLELAQALDSLTDALSLAVRHAQQEESAFQIAPVELILQVTVSWAGARAGGAEWRVLGYGAAAPPGAAAAHSLTMRFTPREARRDSAGPAGRGGGAGQASGGSPPPQLASWHTVSASPGAARTRVRPPGPLPAPADPRLPTAAPGTGPISPLSGPAQGPPGTGPAEGSVPPTTPRGGPYAVRVSFYLDQAASERPGLLVERAAAPVPEQDAAAFAPAADQPDAGPQGREPLVDAIAEYVAGRVDSAAFKPVKQQWEIRGEWNPAAASDQLDGLQKWLLHLVQQPQEDTAAQLGLPPAAAEVAGGVGANIVIAPVTRAVEDLTKIIDIVGIVGGTVLGLHAIALLSFKHLVHTEFHDMVTKAVTKAFDGLTAGTKEVPAPPPGDPVRHPSPPVHRPVVVDPAHPAPDWGPARPASRAPRLSIPLQPPPPRPAPGPPPAPPPTPRPWRPGGPGIGGPGGL